MIENPENVKDSTDLWKFLGPVVGAMVTGFITLIVWWLNRKKPFIIQIIENNKMSLLNIASSVRSRISATFDSRNIYRLTQIEYIIRNHGSDTVKNVNLEFCFGDKTQILECDVNGAAANKEVKDNDHKVVISI